MSWARFRVWYKKIVLCNVILWNVLSAIYKKTIADANNESVAMSSIANSIVTKLSGERVICATCEDEGCA